MNSTRSCMCLKGVEVLMEKSLSHLFHAQCSKSILRLYVSQSPLPLPSVLVHFRLHLFPASAITFLWGRGKETPFKMGHPKLPIKPNLNSIDAQGLRDFEQVTS